MPKKTQQALKIYFVLIYLLHFFCLHSGSRIFKFFMPVKEVHDELFKEQYVKMSLPFQSIKSWWTMIFFSLLVYPQLLSIIAYIFFKELFVSTFQGSCKSVIIGLSKPTP